MGLREGERVMIEPNDSELNVHAQYGRLMGLNSRETVIEIEKGVRLHFPKLGYLVRKAKGGAA